MWHILSFTFVLYLNIYFKKLTFHWNYWVFNMDYKWCQSNRKDIYRQHLEVLTDQFIHYIDYYILLFCVVWLGLKISQPDNRKLNQKIIINFIVTFFLLWVRCHESRPQFSSISSHCIDCCICFCPAACCLSLLWLCCLVWLFIPQVLLSPVVCAWVCMWVCL